MANVAFGWPLFSDVGVSYTPTFAAYGVWSASLPLVNLQDRRLAVVARSTDALAASTKFRIDLGVARAVGVLALPKHNLSAAATVQWLGGTSAGASDVYDSGALAMSFAAVSAEDRDGINFPHVHVPSATKTARYWECDIVDTANVDGYVQLARLVVAGKYQPTVNMSVGANLGLRSSTSREESDGGAFIHQEKPVRRSAAFVLDIMAQAEALGTAWKMERLLNSSRQFMFIWDTADTTYMHERSFLAVLEELSGLEFPYSVSYNQKAVRAVEEL